MEVNYRKNYNYLYFTAYQITVIEDAEKYVLLPKDAKELISVYKQLCKIHSDKTPY